MKNYKSTKTKRSIASCVLWLLIATHSMTGVIVSATDAFALWNEDLMPQDNPFISDKPNDDYRYKAAASTFFFAIIALAGLAGLGHRRNKSKHSVGVNLMRAIHIQTALALIFILLGSWCLFFPLTVEALVFRPEYYVGNSTSSILMGCFGAQAVLAGTIIWTSVFKARTFLVFGLIGSIPFFVFNYYFYFVAEVFSQWMLLDFVGNLGILFCGIVGYRLVKNEATLVNN